jgi:uncharacterized protein with PIN domain
VMNSNRILLAGLFLIGLVACSSQPAVLNESQEGMVVRYNPNAVSTAEAAATAQKVCAKYGRKAVFKASAVTGDVFATYACVK